LIRDCSNAIEGLQEKVDAAAEFVKNNMEIPKPPMADNFIQVLQMCTPLVSEELCAQEIKKDHPILELLVENLVDPDSIYSEETILVMAFAAEVELEGIFCSCVTFEGNTTPDFMKCSAGIIDSIELFKSCEALYDQDGAICDLDGNVQLIKQSLECIEDTEQTLETILVAQY
jgi:hypothetical protein